MQANPSCHFGCWPTCLVHAKLLTVCSRYARWTIIEEIEEFSDLRLPPEPIPVTYNAAPQSVQPIVRLSRAGEPKIVMARWGLIPYWAKDSKIAYSTINAGLKNFQVSRPFVNRLGTGDA
jgi:putative SOS response-associated peptidase YedK